MNRNYYGRFNAKDLSSFYGLNLIIIVFNYLLIIIFLLIGVAFFTLLERKVLGYIHFRYGPNKVGILGIFQPFRDALKLFSKENVKLKKINYYFYIIRPRFGIFLILII